MRKAENGEVGREELIAHLGYVVHVLDYAYSDDSKSVNILFCTLPIVVGMFDIKL